MAETLFTSDDRGVVSIVNSSHYYDGRINDQLNHETGCYEVFIDHTYSGKSKDADVRFISLRAMEDFGSKSRPTNFVDYYDSMPSFFTAPESGNDDRYRSKHAMPLVSAQLLSNLGYAIGTEFTFGKTRMREFYRTPGPETLRRFYEFRQDDHYHIGLKPGLSTPHAKDSALTPEAQYNSLFSAAPYHQKKFRLPYNRYELMDSLKPEKLIGLMTIGLIRDYVEMKGDKREYSPDEKKVLLERFYRAIGEVSWTLLKKNGQDNLMRREIEDSLLVMSSPSIEGTESNIGKITRSEREEIAKQTVRNFNLLNEFGESNKKHIKAINSGKSISKLPQLAA